MRYIVLILLIAFSAYLFIKPRRDMEKREKAYEEAENNKNENLVYTDGHFEAIEDKDEE
ncbi:MAG: hypothetical protein MJ145_00080 [Clostridia bacterium]|nr:hypothetical protein [Clostridia bacterium]